MKYKEIEKQCTQGIEVIYAIKAGGRMSSLFAIFPKWIHGQESMTISKRALLAINMKAGRESSFQQLHNEMEKFSPGLRLFLEKNNINEELDVKAVIGSIHTTMLSITNKTPSLK
jgi:hypothetical protein